MTRPRKEQVLSRNTKYTGFTTEVTPNSEFVDIPVSNFIKGTGPNSSYIGADQNIQAKAIGSLSEPFSILAGEGITIAVGTSSPVNVVFDANDTKASNIASKINLAVGTTVAYNEKGSVRIVVPESTPIEDSRLILSDIVPGTLVKLGLSAGTYEGREAPVVGILTEVPISLEESPDKTPGLELGGIVTLRSADGKNLVTDGSGHLYYEGDKYLVDVPGGLPIHGRLTRPVSTILPTSSPLPVISNVGCRFYTFLPGKANTISSGSNYALITGGDSFNIVVAGQVVPVNFSSAGQTRDSVIDIINDSWVSETEIRSRAYSTKNANYEVDGLTIGIKVDGGPTQLVNFTNEISANDIINTINSSVTGATAVVNVIGIPPETANSFYIQSDSNDPLVSSITIVEVSGSDPALKLGIKPGTYRMAAIAYPYGDEEIKLENPIRGLGNDLVVSGSLAVLDKLGFASGTYEALERVEVSTSLPVTFSSQTSSFNYPVNFLLPEVLEFGDILPNNDREEKTIENTSAGSNLNAQTFFDESGNFRSQDEGKFKGSLSKAGMPIVAGPDGNVPFGQLQNIYDYFLNILKRAFDGSFEPDQPDIFQLKTCRIDCDKGTFTLDVNNISNTDMAAVFDVAGSTHISLRRFSSSDTFGVSEYVDIQKLIRNTVNGIEFADVNTYDYATLNGLNEPFVKLTDTDDASRVIRIWRGDNTGISIIGKINANSIHITLGDGVNTFGDFNGSQALLNAIDFIENLGINAGYHIYAKAGTYNCFEADISANGIVNGRDITIEGSGPRETIFTGLNGFVNDLNATENSVTFKNLFVSSTINSISLRTEKIRLENVITDATITSRSPSSFYMDNCKVQAPGPSGSSCVNITLGKDYSTGGLVGVSEKTINVFNSEFLGQDGQATFSVSLDTDGGNPTSLQTYEKVNFENCFFLVGGTNMLTTLYLANTTWGAIFFDPGVSGPSAFATNPAGFKINQVNIRNCILKSNNTTSSNFTDSQGLLGILPTGKNNSEAYIHGSSPACNLVSVAIEDCKFIPSSLDTSTEFMPKILVGGIGVEQLSTTPGPSETTQGTLLFRNNVVTTDISGTDVNSTWSSGEMVRQAAAWFGDYENPGDVLTTLTIPNTITRGIGGVALAGYNVIVENLHLDRTRRQSSNPSFSAAAYGTLNVRGIKFTNFRDPPLSKVIPITRLYFHKLLDRKSGAYTIEDISFVKTDNDPINSLVEETYAVTGELPAVITISNEAERTLIRNVTYSGFALADISDTVAFIAITDYSGGNGSDFSEYVTIKDCQIAIGSSASASGVGSGDGNYEYFVVNNQFATNGLRIQNNEIWNSRLLKDDNVNFLNTSGVYVQNNVITGPNGTKDNIRMLYNSVLGPAIVTNNAVVGGYTTSNVRIQKSGSSTLALNAMSAVITGNSLTTVNYSTDPLGTITYRFNTSTAAPPANYGEVVRGVETGINVSAPQYTTLSPSMFNIARMDYS